MCQLTHMAHTPYTGWFLSLKNGRRHFAISLIVVFISKKTKNTPPVKYEKKRLCLKTSCHSNSTTKYVHKARRARPWKDKNSLDSRYVFPPHYKITYCIIINYRNQTFQIATHKTPKKKKTCDVSYIWSDQEVLNSH